VPGIWLVATCFDPEPVPDDEGKTATPTIGYGLALALTASAGCQARLSLGPARTDGVTGGVPSLADYLDEPGEAAWHTAAEGGLALQIVAGGPATAQLLRKAS
jgi:hypothetical protein